MGVAVLGAGHVGAVCAAGLASLGHRVRVGESDPVKVQQLNNGDVGLHEDGLGELIERGLVDGRLSFHSANSTVVERAKILLPACQPQRRLMGPPIFPSSRVPSPTSHLTLGPERADVETVLEGMGHDKRIGSRFLQPGPGFGGSCFPKDTSALIAIADDAGYEFSLLKGVIDVNRAHIERTSDKAITALGDIADPHIGLWGLAFKAGTDDVRQSPAVDIARALVDRSIAVTAYDPAVTIAPLSGIEMASSALDAASGADVLVIATECPEFSAIDLGAVHKAMRGSAIVDTRNLLDPQIVRDLGMSYQGTG